MKNGQIYYIDFSGNKGSEINKVHLGIIFTIPKSNNMLFCIPLTSPKEKHFKDILSFENRNHLKLKHQSLVFINQTDSIATLDQMRMISIRRVLNPYRDIVLNDKNIKLLIIKATKYLENILKE